MTYSRRTQTKLASWGSAAVLALILLGIFASNAWPQSVSATIPIPIATTEYLSQALAPARHRLYVIASHAWVPTTLFVVDTNTNAIVETRNFPECLGPMVYNPANDKLYANAQINGYTKEIDPDTFASINIPNGYCPTGLDVNPVTNKIYVSSQCYGGNDKLFVIDGATHAVAGPYDLNGITGSGDDVIVNPATNRIYAPAGTTCSNIKTRVFNGTDNSRLVDLPNVGVHGVDPVHNRVYAVGISPIDCSATDLRVLDGNTHAVIATITNPPYSQFGGPIAVNPDLNRLYAPLWTGNQIAVLETSNYTEVARVSVANGPSRVNVDRTTARVYVAHNGSVRQITVLEEAPEEFYDPFDSSTLDPAWTVQQGRGSYSLTENPGHLRYRVEPTHPDLKATILSRPFRGDNWTFETKVNYYLGPSGGGRGLGINIDFGTPTPLEPCAAPDFVEIARRVDRWWEGQSQGAVIQTYFENGVGLPPWPAAYPPNPSDTYVLRVRREGRTVTFELSDDGVNPRVSSSHTYGPEIDNVIQYLFIFGGSFANYDSYADYDYVRLTKGQPNQPPAASAGPDQTLECGGAAGCSATLDGSGSSDPDNDPLSFEWKDAAGNVVGNTATLNLTVPLGTHTFTLTVNDGKGGTASDDAVVTVRDTTSPTLTLAHNATTVVLPTATATGAQVDVLAASGATATDNCDPSPTITHNGLAEFPVGLTVVTITAADHSGNLSQRQFTVQVVYNFIGFLQPINSDGSSLFRLGRTIPIKFQLTAADGTFITNATATLQVFKVSDAVTGTVEEITPDASGNSNTGTVFRFDPLTNQYVYNLSTVGYSAGTYLLRVTLNDQTRHEVQLSMR